MQTPTDVQGLPPWRKFLLLLKGERRTIGYIYTYAVFSGLIGLSLPLGIQSLIGFISSGQITTSIFVLIGLVIIGMLITGGLQVMQLHLVEHIQQKIFAKTAYEFSFRIPRMKREALFSRNPPELVNRFFEVVSIQKGLGKVLIDLSAAALQIFFGLILLSFYHPYFIFFGIFLVLVLSLILYLTGGKGMKTSLMESKYKYKLVNWMQELARSLNTFKSAGYSKIWLKKTDDFTQNYIEARNEHFKVLVTQYFSFIFFKTMITAALLITGALLVLNQQINIGQFVASEIVVIMIMAAVEKVLTKLETVYDLCTNAEKLSQVTSVPIEEKTGIQFEEFAHEPNFSLTVKGLSYRYPAKDRPVLDNISFEVAKGERVCLYGRNGSGKSTLVNILLGYIHDFDGIVAYDGLSLRDINRDSLHAFVGNNSEETLFEGTIAENLHLGRNDIPFEKVLWAVEFVGLTPWVQSLPDGFDTLLPGGSKWLQESITEKLILARCIAEIPKFLVLENLLPNVDPAERKRIIEKLMDRKNAWSILFIGNDISIPQMCDRTIELRNGCILEAVKETY